MARKPKIDPALDTTQYPFKMVIDSDAMINAKAINRYLDANVDVNYLETNERRSYVRWCNTDSFEESVRELLPNAL